MLTFGPDADKDVRGPSDAQALAVVSRSRHKLIRHALSLAARFHRQLDAEGELVCVREPVSTVLEMTEIQTRLIAEGGPAVISKSAQGRWHAERHAGAGQSVRHGQAGRHGRDDGRHRSRHGTLREVGELLASLRQPQPPRSFGEALELLPLAKTVLAMKPKTVAAARLPGGRAAGRRYRSSKLPVQTCWPGEPAPLITWPLVVTKGPGDAREDNYNLGIYRMQVLNKNQTIMRWLKHRGGAQHHARWGKRKTRPCPRPR